MDPGRTVPVGAAWVTLRGRRAGSGTPGAYRRVRNRARPVPARTATVAAMNGATEGRRPGQSVVSRPPTARMGSGRDGQPGGGRLLSPGVDGAGAADGPGPPAGLTVDGLGVHPLGVDGGDVWFAPGRWGTHAGGAPGCPPDRGHRSPCRYRCRPPSSGTAARSPRASRHSSATAIPAGCRCGLPVDGPDLGWRRAPGSDFSTGGIRDECRPWRLDSPVDPPDRRPGGRARPVHLRPHGVHAPVRCGDPGPGVRLGRPAVRAVRERGPRPARARRTASPDTTHLRDARRHRGSSAPVRPTPWPW